MPSRLSLRRASAPSPAGVAAALAGVGVGGGLQVVALGKSTTQTLTAGTVTAITFDVERLDGGGRHSSTNPERVTFAEAGTWLILSFINFGGDSSTSRRDSAIKLNAGGTTLVAGYQRGEGDSSELYQAVSCWCVVTVAPGDYIWTTLWSESVGTTVQATSSLIGVRLA